MTAGDRLTDRDDGARSRAPSLTLLERNLPGTVYRCRIDAQWTLLYASESLTRLTGYPVHELLHNRRLAFADLIHPEDRIGVARTVEEAVSAGRPFAVSYRIITADGTEKWVLEHGCAVHDAHGVATELEGYLSDITEAQQTQQRIALLDFALDHARDALYLIDGHARIVDVNRRACQMLGYGRAELLQLTVEDLNTEFTPQHWARHWQELREHRTLTLESTHRRRDGTLVPVEISANHFEYRGREYNLALAHDISGRMRSRSLQALQARVLEMIASGTPLEEVLEAIAGGMEAHVPGAMAAIMRLAGDGLHLRVGAAPTLPPEFNRAADGMPIGNEHGSCGTAAWRREPVFVSDIDTDPLWVMGREIAGAHGLRACWSWPVIGAGGDVLATLALYRREPGLPADEHTELIERIIHLTRVALEHERKERALQASEERLRYAVQAMADVVWDWDLVTDHVRRDARGASAFGYSAEEISGDGGPWVDRVHPDDLPAVHAVLRSVRAGSAAHDHVSSDYRFRRRDGSWAHVNDNCTLIRDKQGHVVRAIGGMRDISDRVALEQRLRQAQRMEAVGQLTGGIAHDFNNLLTVILGNAELLREGGGDEAARGRLAGMIVDAAARGGELTAHLLAFSRRQPLQPRSVNVRELVAGMRQLLHRTLGDRIEVEERLDEALWPALIDPAQLESSLLNLCLNARDAMPDGGRLLVSAGNARLTADADERPEGLAPGDYVTVTVTDTGTGIAADELPRVFEPFYTTKRGGTGLGLSMVFGFAQQSRGHVRIDSTPGSGTVVQLHLPRADAGAGREPVEPSATGAERRPRGGESVLLVEDDALVRAYAEQQLSNLGYRVTAAEHGARALELLAADLKVDLLFTDVMMPGMTGPQLAAAARAMGCNPKVLYTSGFAELEVLESGGPSADAPLLAKPYRGNDLAQRVRQALDGPADGA